MDRAAIEAAVPHRAPFLFVDRVLALQEGSITTEWDVAPDLECFRGHYPGFPLLPGVIASEFAFQSAAVLLMSGSAGTRAKAAAGSAIPMLTKIEEARFKKTVRPGETLRALVDRIESVGDVHFFKATLTSAGATILKVRFTVALVAAGA
jgi:3-hydroxyacyl-[acyl-carrier-protein] dehydratase